MIRKLLDSQSFSTVWKSAVRQRFCAVASKIWPRDIVCGPLREHVLFAYPTNFTASFENNLHWLHYLELRLKTCDYMKSVIVWNISFRLASRSFKNTGPNSTIFNRSKPMFWSSSSLENCNTYVVLINMKHSTESKTQTGFNRTIIPWQNTFSLRTNVNGLSTRVEILCLVDEITIQSSPWVFFPAFRLPAPPLRI